MQTELYEQHQIALDTSSNLLIFMRNESGLEWQQQIHDPEHIPV